MISKTIMASIAAMSAVQAGDTNFWKTKTVYQVLTDRFAKDSNGGSACTNLSNYCGGTWKGIENNLDYIQGMGFDAIWISPVVDNLEPGYHGYWAKDWTKRNSHFGSDDDLKNLVKAAHAKGISVMVDVVANHSAPIGDDFSQIYPLNKSEHYHNDCGIDDWSNQWQVENCRLAGLPDLNQGNDYVRGFLKDWIKNLVKDFDFDGIRIDTIPEVPKDFWAEYRDASGVFQMGEVFNGDPAYVGQYQGALNGLFNYPMYFTIKDVFGSGQSMYNIRTRYNEDESHYSDIDALGLFVDNHDNARFMNLYNNQASFKSALAFALTGRGIPFYYYGSEQAYGGGNDPQNRESLWQDMNTNSDIYQMTAKINAARKAHQIWNHPLEEKYVGDNVYAFNRGDFFIGLTNGSNDVDVQPASPWNDGTKVCNIFYPDTDCQTISGGKLNLSLKNGEVKVYIPSDSEYYTGQPKGDYAFLQ